MRIEIDAQEISTNNSITFSYIVKKYIEGKIAEKRTKKILFLVWKNIDERF